MTGSYRLPDVRSLGDEELAEAGFPAPRSAAFRIYLDADVHAGIASHVSGDTSVEVGGVLVGQWHRDADGPFVHVSRFIVCDTSQSRAAEMTFTHDAWAKINHEMDTRYGDLRIVGWYHSHPDFGVFLSDRDRFIQEHFFSNPGQIAYVVDPVRKTEGVFVWEDAKPVLAEHYWVGERIVVASQHAADERPPSGDGRTETAGSPAAQAPPSGSTLLTLAVYLLVFLLGYLIASGMRTLDRHRLVEGTVAHYGIWKGLRPGLSEALFEVDAELADASAALDALPASPAGSADEQDDAETAEGPDDRYLLKSHLATASRRLAQIREAYCLTPEEAAVVAQIIAIKTAQVNAPAESGERADDGETTQKTGAGVPQNADGPSAQDSEQPPTRQPRSDR